MELTRDAGVALPHGTAPQAKAMLAVLAALAARLSAPARACGLSDCLQGASL